jgi:class 3 adenylate cyclase
MSRSTHHDLMLNLLEQTARSTGVHARGRATRSAMDALEAEALVERRGGVYRATPAGTKALEERGRGFAPGGELAVLFTDIEGSTQLIERLGENAALRLLRRHFALLRTAAAEHHGREVKSLGDGLMIVFTAVPDAVACAAAMQEAVLCEQELLGLRIGIHAGEPTREGDDYFGTPVIIARRLCDSAGPGQTLVSDAVSRLVAERQFEPLGRLTLKGLSRQVLASALAGVSPPIGDRLPVTATSA